MNTTKNIEILWDFLHLKHKLEKADVILVFGSHDDGVSKHAIQLYKKRFAPLLVFSGGLGKITKDTQKISEAERFAQIALSEDVIKGDIIVEPKSSNTRENVIFTKSLLGVKGINVKKIIIVTKPYMERRAYATFKKFWKGVKVIASSQEISQNDYLSSYPRKGVTKADTISLIVGELNRILVLPQMNLQIRQRVPKAVLLAYESLVKEGYTKYIWKQEG